MSSRGQLTWGGSSTWGLGKLLTTPHHKNESYYNMFIQKASDLD